MGYLLEDRTIYLDRFVVAGEWTLDLATTLMSAEAKTNYPPSSSLTITAGNSAGHFSVTSGVLGVSSAGDAADLSSGTYTFTVAGTFSSFPAPYNTDTCTLKIVCPAASIYVDPIAGSSTNPGTKAAPFSRSPDDALAAGNELAFAPVVPTLCVHKDGSFIRSNLILRNVNTINAGRVGWGNNSPVTYCGADTLAATAAASEDVFSNPNVANIKKQTVPSGKLHISQYLIDRDNNSLMHWAQWPAVIGDPFLEAHDPQHHLTGGMFRMPAANVPVHDVNTTNSSGEPVTIVGVMNGTLTLPAAAITEFGTKSLKGAYLGLWTYASFVNWYLITDHDTSTNVITFDPGAGSNRVLQTVMEGGVATTAFQIVGHPHSIKAAGQFAWSEDLTTVYSWPVSGTNPEITMRKSALYSGPSNNSGTMFGLDIEGYHGTSDGEGSGWQKYANGLDYTYNILASNFRWLINRVGNGGAIRANNIGAAVGMLVEGNFMRDCMGAAAMRVSTTRGNVDCIVQSNRFKRLNVTAVYWPAATRLIYQRNHMEDILGPHANGFTIYRSGTILSPPDNIIRYNTFKRVCRPMTLDTCTRLKVYRNFFEIDGIVKDAVRFYGVEPDAEIYENIFCQPEGVTPTGEDVLAAGTVGAGTWSRNVIGGLTGGQGSTTTPGSANWIDNLQSYIPPNSTDLTVNGARNPTINTGAWSGNFYERGDYNGTILPRWKQVVGAGPIARGMMISGIAVISFTNLTNQLPNVLVESDWKELDSDSVRPISITGGEYNIANDANGTGAVGWSSAPSTVADGKFIKLRMTTQNSYETTKTLTLDLGSGNSYTWSTRTKQASGFPLVAVDKTNDFWVMNPAGPVAPITSDKLTFAFFGRIDGIHPDAMANANMLLGHYAGGASTRVMIETIASGRLRFTGRAAASPDTSFSFQTPILPTNENVMVQVTVDLSKATATEGVRIYINGVSGAPTSVSPWNPSTFIDWTQSFLFKAIGQSYNGLVGMMLLDNRWVDLDDANVRDKFNAHRIGINGENIFGTAPAIFLVGDAATWNNASIGINRGTQNKLKAQSNTAVTLDIGGANTWPSYTFATAVTGLTGPSGVTGQVKSYSISTNGALANPLDVVLTDGGRGGTFSPNTVVFSPSTTAQTSMFNYTPATAGTTTITATPTGLTPDTLTIDVTNFYTTLPKGTSTILTRAQFNNLLQRVGNAAGGDVPENVQFVYPKNDGSGLFKKVNLFYNIVYTKTIPIGQNGISNLIGDELNSVPINNTITITIDPSSPLIQYLD